MKVDIIIQGGLYPGTIETANFYAMHELVNRVVVSTWEGENVNLLHADNVILLKNKKPDYFGPGNLNLHLLSSKKGLEKCETDVILKIRSDEKIFYDGLTTWINFFNNNKDQETLNYLDGTKQKSKIHVIATNINYPYHPQDHVFIAHKEDLKKLFNMPFSYESPIGPEPVDFSVHLRNPIYIGANYYSLFYEEAQNHLKNRKTFLLDDSLHRAEALEFYLKNRNTIFQPLPRINMWWEKFNTEYWWDGYAKGGDCYAD